MVVKVVETVVQGCMALGWADSMSTMVAPPKGIRFFPS